MEYNEEDFLQLSGLQHFIFCPRQWALIHIENQWAENKKTVDGEFFHQKAHDSASHEKRGDILVSRGMYIHSRSLGITGQCDIVEFHRNEKGVTLSKEEGKWLPFPIEYKRGRAKKDLSDKAQVCAQAMCLEEMYCCDIPQGAIFYGEPRRRLELEFSEDLRDTVRDSLKKMHELYKKGKTPRAKYRSVCESCSLKEICVPELSSRESVNTYIRRMVKMDS